MKTGAAGQDDLAAIDELTDDAEPKAPAFGSAPPESPAAESARAETKTRRAKAREEQEAREAALNDRFSRLEGTIGMSQQQIQALNNENARLRGFLEARQQQEPAAPRGPSPDELRELAEKALDEKDLPKYHKLLSAAIRGEVLAGLPRQEQQQAAPANTGPPLGFQIALANNLSRSPKLAELPEEQWQARVNAESQVLIAEGGRPGPALLAKAFKNCETRITDKTRATFSTAGRGMLAGDRHVNGSGAGGDDDDGSSGTEAQRAMWAKFNLPPEGLKRRL